MSSVLDLWRAVEPDGRLVSGAIEGLARPVRGVLRSRAAPPHLPPAADGELLIIDARLVRNGDLEELDAALADAGLAPSAVVLAGSPRPAALERAGSPLPIIAGPGTMSALADAATAYLEDESSWLAALAAGLRLAAAEAALADPRPSAPAGEVAARLRRGVAIAVDGRLVSLNPRPAGEAVATRFAATFARLLDRGGDREGSGVRMSGGLSILERSIGPTAAVFVFDDLPMARVDHTAADALSITLRALMRRPPAGTAPRAIRREPPSSGDPLRDTLLAVARANGRVVPAARTLGVHRNTVLYRLRRASAEQGIDPRRPEDARRLLDEASSG